MILSASSPTLKTKFRVTLIALTGLLAQMAGADTLTIRSDEWAPINTDPRATNRGIMVDVAEAILAPAGHTVDYQLLAWDDAKKAVVEGKFDCIVGALANEAGEGFIRPKQPWVVSQQTVYARADKNFGPISNVNALSTFSLGVSNDYSYGEGLDDYIAKNASDPSKIFVARGQRPIRELLLRLSVNQIQLALETNVVMDYTLAQTRLDNKIKAVGSPITERDELFIACSAKKASTKTYIKLFDEGLPALRNDGRFAAILAKYGLKDWQ